LSGAFLFVLFAAVHEIVAQYGNVGAYTEVRDYEKARRIYRYAVDTWPDAEHAADSQRAVAWTSILLGRVFCSVRKLRGRLR